MKVYKIILNQYHNIINTKEICYGNLSFSVKSELMRDGWCENVSKSDNRVLLINISTEPPTDIFYFKTYNRYRNKTLNYFKNIKLKEFLS